MVFAPALRNVFVPLPLNPANCPVPPDTIQVALPSTGLPKDPPGAGTWWNEPPGPQIAPVSLSVRVLPSLSVNTTVASYAAQDAEVGAKASITKLYSATPTPAIVALAQTKAPFAHEGQKGIVGDLLSPQWARGPLTSA